MSKSPRRAIRLASAVLLWALATGASAASPPQPPSVAFCDLFARVQTSGIFLDSKAFADATPRRSPAEIMEIYRTHPPVSRAELQTFLEQYFDLPPVGKVTPVTDPPRAPIETHIASLWPVLTRSPVDPPQWSSQLALSHPYVAPGGRFRELYYWDSYFTMLGLVRDGRRDLADDMTDDFADLIARYGHVPNGARTYYLSRSQPPVFYLMVGLTSDDVGQANARYLAALRREYRFWMKGEANLKPGHAYAHVVRLRDGAVLNRYWDARAAPRDEAYVEDLKTAEAASRPPRDVYRDLRSAAESGWDFSSRWLADGRSLSTIETTSIIPVDLNSLLFGLEQAIATGCRQTHDQACAKAFVRRAKARRSAIARYLWSGRRGEFLDYQWMTGRQLDRPSAAMLYPLFTGVASPAQAEDVAAIVRSQLLAPGGLRTTTTQTGQQWDEPNGWAPLQWIAFRGLSDYGETDLARTIAARWLNTVCRAYAETGKLLEKYNVETAEPGGGGEYPLQDGFGWTNGVTRALLGDVPQPKMCAAGVTPD